MVLVSPLMNRTRAPQKSPRRTIEGSSFPDVPRRAPVKARYGTPHRSATVGTPRTITLKGAEVSCVECEGALLSTSPESIRVRVGATRDSQQLGRMLFLPDNGPPAWIHADCARSAGAMPLICPANKCPLCGEYFYGVDSGFPHETVMEFILGNFIWTPGEPEPVFKSERIWFAHWACVDDLTGLRVTG